MGLSSPGIGSNLDVNGIVSKLMQVESQPLTTIAQKEASYQAKLSAFGTLSGALSGFQTAIGSLGSLSTFQTMKASLADATVGSATATTSAPLGTYNINVTQLAQAQSLSTTGVTSSTAAIGSGASSTISFQFGTIATGTNGTTFTQDGTQPGGTLTVSTNNSLEGIRDAINGANLGVSASIVSDGSATPYHLVLTSTKTGANSSMKITVSGDSALSTLLSQDPAGTQNLAETVKAQDTLLTVNGLAVKSAGNTVTDAIQGTTLTVTGTGATSLSISRDTSPIVSGVNALVNAYNSLDSTIDSLGGYDPNTKVAGVLNGNATLRQVQSRIRDALSQRLLGNSGSLENLTQLGISFNKDGSMALDQTALQSAVTDHFADVGQLFAKMATATDSLVSYVGSSSNTQPGTYALNITQLATQGQTSGIINLNAASTVIGNNAAISVTLDGMAANVSLTPGTYTGSALAAMLQSAINGTSMFSSAGSSVSTSVDANGLLHLTSLRYGSSSNVSLANAGTDTTATAIMGSNAAASAGVDVAGTIGGFAATGSGKVLMGGSGTPVDGLRLNVADGATGGRGSVTFSTGYSTLLNSVFSSYLGPDGIIQGNTDGLNSTIQDLQAQTETLNTQLADKQKRYLAQFTALDTMISSMNATMSYLTQQIAQFQANGSGK